MNKVSLISYGKVFIAVIIFGAVAALLAVTAIVMVQFLPVPSQLKFALGFIFAMFLWWLVLLKAYKFVENFLIKSKS
jgi:hypothetical protein